MCSPWQLRPLVVGFLYLEGLIEGAILAVLVVFLFLRDIRATMISAVAIPLFGEPLDCRPAEEGERRVLQL